jgi:hypothetical protein
MSHGSLASNTASVDGDLLQRVKRIDRARAGDELPEIVAKLFMIIERFRDNDMLPVYRRLREVGRSPPERLEYVDSSVEANFSRCFHSCAATT